MRFDFIEHVYPVLFLISFYLVIRCVLKIVHAVCHRAIGLRVEITANNHWDFGCVKSVHKLRDLELKPEALAILDVVILGVPMNVCIGHYYLVATLKMLQQAN